MERKPSRIDYNHKGFWKGLAAFKKLAKEPGVSENVAKLWLMKQAIQQIYSPTLKHIPRPTFDVESPNTVHQADLLFLPYDKATERSRKVYKYAQTVDVTSRLKASEPLTSKDSSEVSKAFQTIYKRDKRIIQNDNIQTLYITQERDIVKRVSKLFTYEQFKLPLKSSLHNFKMCKNCVLKSRLILRLT